MKNYSVDIKDREKVYFVAAILAILAVYAASLALTYFENLLGQSSSISVLSSFSLFGLVLIFYDKFWNTKLLKWTNRIPDFNGTWEGELKRQNPPQSLDIKVYIKQTFRKIEIRLESKEATSASKMASIAIEEESQPIIRFSYFRELLDFQIQDRLELYSQGLTQLRLSANSKQGSELMGWYVGQHSQGTIRLKKI